MQRATCTSCALPFLAQMARPCCSGRAIKRHYRTPRRQVNSKTPRTPPSSARHPCCILFPPPPAVTIQRAHPSCIPTHPPLPSPGRLPLLLLSHHRRTSLILMPILAYCHGCLAPSLLLCRHRHRAARTSQVRGPCVSAFGAGEAVEERSASSCAPVMIQVGME